MKKRDVWVTRDKQEIPIKDMPTSHLTNAIQMLERKGFIGTMELDTFAWCPFSPDTAAYDAWFCELRQLKYSPQLDNMKEELRRRSNKEV